MMAIRADAALCTDEQWSYIRRLMHQAFARGCKTMPNLDVHHMPRHYLKSAASADIKRLLVLKANGWK